MILLPWRLLTLPPSTLPNKELGSADTNEPEFVVLANIIVIVVVVILAIVVVALTIFVAQGAVILLFLQSQDCQCCKLPLGRGQWLRTREQVRVVLLKREGVDGVNMKRRGTAFGSPQ